MVIGLTILLMFLVLFHITTPTKIGVTEFTFTYPEPDSAINVRNHEIANELLSDLTVLKDISSGLRYRMFENKELKVKYDIVQKYELMASRDLLEVSVCINRNVRYNERLHKPYKDIIENKEWYSYIL